jgi:hypothetical protein
MKALLFVRLWLVSMFVIFVALETTAQVGDTLIFEKNDTSLALIFLKASDSLIKAYDFEAGLVNAKKSFKHLQSIQSPQHRFCALSRK